MAEEPPQPEKPLGFIRSNFKRYVTDPMDKFCANGKPNPDDSWKGKLQKLEMEIQKDPFREEDDFKSFRQIEKVFSARNKPRPVPYTGNNIITTSSVGGSLADSFCDKIELKALECVEYYGVSRGLKICRDYYDDYMECTLRTKQELHAKAIARQRARRYNEYLLGKRSYDTVYGRTPNPIVTRRITSSPEFNFTD